MERKRTKVIGKMEYIQDCAEMTSIFLEISKEDERTAEVLYKFGIYNQAVYFFIQAMEKYTKSFICSKINILRNKASADMLRDTGHSINKSIDLLVKIMAAGNDIMEQQITNQIKMNVLHNINFSKLYNDVRYPSYSNYHKDYRILKISKEDCEEVKQIFEVFKKTIQDFKIM